MVGVWLTSSLSIRPKTESMNKLSSILPTVFNSHHRVVHRLRNPKSVGKRVLIITGYDYFLTKRDLKRLMPLYQEIVLVPRRTDDDHLINDTFQPLLNSCQELHLVANPTHDSQYQLVHQLVIQENKSVEISTIADFCKQHLQKVYIAENAQELTWPDQLPPFRPEVRKFKKALDLVTSLGFLTLTSPLWLWSAWKIKQQSPGPVLYRQSRVGVADEEFQCIKFRSMRLDAEASGALFSSRRDTRTFPFGAFMRKIRLDELPQFLNVLRGEMSLVGPRPERRVFTQKFEEQIPHYANRHVVRPGITGYAQICYPYGAGAKDARHKLMYDLYYIEHWTLSLEMYILWRTFITVVTKQGC